MRPVWIRKRSDRGEHGVFNRDALSGIACRLWAVCRSPDPLRAMGRPRPGVCAGRRFSKPDQFEPRRSGATILARSRKRCAGGAAHVWRIRADLAHELHLWLLCCGSIDGPRTGWQLTVETASSMFGGHVACLDDSTLTRSWPPVVRPIAGTRGCACGQDRQIKNA